MLRKHGSGEKSDDPLSPNYVPSVFVFTKPPEKRQKALLLKTSERRMQRLLLPQPGEVVLDVINIE